MKFIGKPNELLSEYLVISPLVNSNVYTSDALWSVFFENCTVKIKRKSEGFIFNKRYEEYNFLLKILKPQTESLHTSKYSKSKKPLFNLQQVKYSNEILQAISVKQVKEPVKLDLSALYSGSVNQLIRLLAIYTGRLQSILFRVLRNTRIHSLSIFFGLCCSSSGYIFEAITGTSSHPIPDCLKY